MKNAQEVLSMVAKNKENIINRYISDIEIIILEEVDLGGTRTDVDMYFHNMTQIQAEKLCSDVINVLRSNGYAASRIKPFYLSKEERSHDFHATQISIDWSA